jgi:hypothetical protein
MVNRPVNVIRKNKKYESLLNVFIQVASILDRNLKHIKLEGRIVKWKSTIISQTVQTHYRSVIKVQ